jgi:predicted ATP-dependent Lon-type protease
MAKYCELTDFTDSLITGNVTEEILLKVDNYIDALLKQIGIDPATINPVILLIFLFSKNLQSILVVT